MNGSIGTMIPCMKRSVKSPIATALLVNFGFDRRDSMEELVCVVISATEIGVMAEN